MTISNAIPVQFWLNGVETFNEKTICGVEPVCFCQPFNCTDEIKIQFTDTSNNHFLSVIDSNGNTLHQIAFDDVSSNVWQLSFIPLNYGICNEIIQLKITSPDPTLAVLSAWTNRGSSPAVDWTTGSNPSRTLLPAFAYTKYLSTTFYARAGQPYQFNYSFDVSGYANLNYFTVSFLNSSLVVVGSYDFIIDIISDGLYTGTVSITPTFGSTYIAFSFGVNDAVTNVTIDINSFSYVAQSNYLWAQSDCIYVKTSHDCTVLLEYTNSSDFDGIVYETSPTSEFNLRIPAQFWKEDNPMEQEDSELSNGVIKTRRQTIEEKTLLEIGYVPNYMHKKIQKALMHDTLTMEGSQWKKRDAYEGENINRYPLKRANVWLTLYNSIEDNIL